MLLESLSDKMYVVAHTLKCFVFWPKTFNFSFQMKKFTFKLWNLF